MFPKSICFIKMWRINRFSEFTLEICFILGKKWLFCFFRITDIWVLSVVARCVHMCLFKQNICEFARKMLQSWEIQGFKDGTRGKEPARQCRRCNRLGFSPRVRRCPADRHGNPLQYSSLGSPMDTRARWVRVHRVAKSWTQLKQLSTDTSEIYVTLKIW